MIIRYNIKDVDELNIIAIRGATNIYHNTKDDILIESKKLLEEMILKNNLEIDNIISIFFTMTDDLTKLYPAVAARELGIVNAGLMCFNEMNIENSMKNCLRILIHYEGNIDRKKVKHIYLKETISLRPDLIEKEVE